MKRARQKCEADKVKEFDYSKLSADFVKLSKPARRALINARIFSARDLSRRTLEEISELHGIGPSAFPILRAVLKARGLDFKARR